MAFFVWFFSERQVQLHRSVAQQPPCAVQREREDSQRGVLCQGNGRHSSLLRHLLLRGNIQVYVSNNLFINYQVTFCKCRQWTRDPLVQT